MSLGNINIEGARIIFRNFSGEPGKFNAKGVRSFCVLLDADTAQDLAADGWAVRYLNPREPGDEPQAYLKVGLRYDILPPKAMVITSKKKTLLDEDTIGTLDWAEIQNVDLIIRPYEWTINGKSGVKAYLKSIYVTIVEDKFEAKYSDIGEE